MASSERFGFEWQTYNYMLPEYESQFLKWVFPLTAESFTGKTILDAGSGMGRNAYWCLTYGAERVDAFDLDTRSVNATRATLASFHNAHVYLADIKQFNEGRQYDIVYSIGVIHHLRNPEDAL